MIVVVFLLASKCYDYEMRKVCRNEWALCCCCCAERVSQRRKSEPDVIKGRYGGKK